MRIVNKQEFYSLPQGTLYSKFEPQIFRGLFIKMETIYHDGIPKDYIYKNLIGNIDAESSDDEFYILLNAEENGTSFKLDFDCSERDGFFDETQMYAIYDQEDIIGLINKLNGLT